jgi:hypothetical protein
VGWPQLVTGLALTAMLLVSAVVFTNVQIRLLRSTARSTDLADDERRHLRRRAWRRLFGCLLLFLLGIQLYVALVFLENPSQQLADEQADSSRQLTPDERSFLRLYGWFWIVFLLLLLTLVLLAAFEMWSVRRRGVQERRRLLADRRAMLEHQVGRLRQERNGHA